MTFYVYNGANINTIELLIGKKLEELDNDSIWKRNGYTLDDNKRIVALNLCDCSLQNIHFLKDFDFRFLEKLSLKNDIIYDFSALKELNNLKSLSLNNTQITEISELKKLVNLKHLYLENNKISDINWLEALNNLEKLYLSYNEIKDISVLQKLKGLIYLDLKNNNIDDINSLESLNNLKWLNLSDNEITKLPEWLLNIGLDIKLDDSNYGVIIKGNPIISPPLEIIQQGNESIKNFFRQLEKGYDYFYEAKLILVGEAGAGKTSLANKIRNPDYQLRVDNEDNSTHGITILSHSFKYQGHEFKINIWDFGGQEIYHQTHKFFLTKRSLYLLVADNRKEDTDFYFWLNLVNLLTDNSPLLIIKNEKSNHSRDIPEQELKEFNNIKEILATDLSDNRGLIKIIKDLQHYITTLPHIGSPLPKTWVKVREQLEQLAKQKNCIDLKEYFEICQANGVEKEADKLQLSEYLHDLGVCLHFQKHPLLLKTLILKPTWATDAVYKVLDNNTVKKQAGHFNDKDLADIWQDEQYNTMRGELLALMQKFKLCYEIRNQPQHYIAPQLLKDKSPQYEWQSNDNLLLRYKYDFMPKGILSQFIVEMHEHIANNYQWVWKSGVILEKDKTQAEIIEYYGKREIHIRVHGNNKKELLNIVSYELDKINGSYERLKDKCKKLIPCNCERCKDLQEPQEPYFYDYAKLKERITHQKNTIECGNPPYNEVNVLKLIDDINLPDFKNPEGLNNETVVAKQTYHNCTFNQPSGNISMNNEEHNIHAENSQVQQFNESSNNTATQNQNKPPETKEDSLFKSPVFLIFIAIVLVIISITFLQHEGNLGNKTYERILSSVFPSLSADNKK